MEWRVCCHGNRCVSALLIWSQTFLLLVLWLSLQDSQKPMLLICIFLLVLVAAEIWHITVALLNSIEEPLLYYFNTLIREAALRKRQDWGVGMLCPTWRLSSPGCLWPCFWAAVQTPSLWAVWTGHSWCCLLAREPPSAPAVFSDWSGWPGCWAAVQISPCGSTHSRCQMMTGRSQLQCLLIPCKYPQSCL